MNNEDLYRRGYSTPLLKYITKDQAEYDLKKIHEGVCDNHSGARTMAAKVLKADFYWPTLWGDYAEYVKKCTKCQDFGPLHHLKSKALHNMTSSWSFAIWGIDIIRPFAPGKGQTKFFLVGVDYFIKWIETNHSRPSPSKRGKFCMAKYSLPIRSVTHNNNQQ